MKEFDAIVVGSGPAGITAALYLVRAGYKTAIVEKDSPGGQVLSTMEVENYPGFPKGVKGWELSDLFSAHLDEYPTENIPRIKGDIISMESGSKHTLHLAEGEESITAPAVIIASGARHRDLEAPGEDRLRGKGVSYCALCDGNFYRNLDVAVVGGGNSALEESLYLSKIARKVYIIHRREGFRGAKVYLDKIAMSDKMEVLTPYTIDNLVGENALEALELRNAQTNEVKRIDVEGLFVYVGILPNSGYLPESVSRTPQGFIPTDQEMRTNVPGIFAAGDVRDKACRQISTAVGDGATAATAAISYLELLNV